MEDKKFNRLIDKKILKRLYDILKIYIKRNKFKKKK